MFRKTIPTIFEMEMLCTLCMPIPTCFFNSFFPSTIHAWNELSEEIKEANTVSEFKYRLNRNKRSPPKYYNVGRIGQTLHARIRMECSSLNLHLFRKNIVASPTCICGSFESPYHFFFICPRYTGIRNTYLSNILQTHCSKELLFGKDTASVDENETLFLKTIHLSCDACYSTPKPKYETPVKTCLKSKSLSWNMYVKITCIPWESVKCSIFPLPAL